MIALIINMTLKRNVSRTLVERTERCRARWRERFYENPVRMKAIDEQDLIRLAKPQRRYDEMDL
jgi:hypothetical protein